MKKDVRPQVRGSSGVCFLGSDQGSRLRPSCFIALRSSTSFSAYSGYFLSKKKKKRGLKCSCMGLSAISLLSFLLFLSSLQVETSKWGFSLLCLFGVGLF